MKRLKRLVTIALVVVGLPKPRGTLRVYCLGDSFTFGPYLAGSQTYPALLENRLRRLYPQQQVEVLNAGVAGYSLRQETEPFLTRGWKSRPDLVLLHVRDDHLLGYAGGWPPGPRHLDQIWLQTLSYRLRLWIRQGARYDIYCVLFVSEQGNNINKQNKHGTTKFFRSVTPPSSPGAFRQ